MNPWFGKVAFIIGFFTIGHFRDPYIKKNKKIKIIEDRKTKFDISLIVITTMGQFLLPLLWMIFDIFHFADYPLYPSMLVAGVAIYAFGLWLFKRSHDDLGTNWSVSLELKENHRLVTNGIYKSIRHPMYTSLFVCTSAQIFLLSNWIIGPAGIITFAAIYFGRVKSEEKMMLDQFGEEYRIYMSQTKRVIPGIW